MAERTTFTLLYDESYKHYAVMFRTEKGAHHWLQDREGSGEIVGILIHHNLTDEIVWRNSNLDDFWIEKVLASWKQKKSTLSPRKKLTKILANCQRCPYSKYSKISDPMDIKFGYTCTRVKPHRVIFEILPEPNRKLKKVVIPDWCPLGDYVSPEKKYRLK